MTPIEEDLKSTGLKATLPRLKILELFQKSNLRHLSAEDIYRTVLDGGSSGHVKPTHNLRSAATLTEKTP